VKGVVLAAGQAQRLRPLTADLPKTLLPVDGDKTILDLTLANLRAVGIEDVAIVTGFAAERLEERAGELERRHGVRLELIRNDRPEWNNAYSLWMARSVLRDGALLVNGDTVHPVAVEERLLAARGPGLLLAVDAEKTLGEEEMKVLLSPAGTLQRIHKGVDPAAAQGEYIGVALIEPAAAEPLCEALEATWQRDTTLYYEDGFQAYADGGAEVGAAPIGAVAWVEVDDHADLARARELAGRMQPGAG
jgi:choline kinase